MPDQPNDASRTPTYPELSYPELNHPEFGYPELTSLEGLGTDDGRWWIADHGSQVMSWQPRGERYPVIWHAPDSLWESPLDDQDGPYLRGGIPVCFPWFGAGGVPAHGLARRQVWERLEGGFTATTPATDTTSAPEATSATLATKHWLLADQLEAWHTVTMSDDALELVLEFTNHGTEPARVEAAHHTYLAVSDVTQISLTGLEGARYWDAARDLINQIPAGPTQIHPRTDAVIDTTADITLTDPGWQRELRIVREGSPQVVVWNSRPPVDPGLGVTNDRWREFCCIETAICRERAVVLQPDESHRLVTRVTSHAIAR